MGYRIPRIEKHHRITWIDGVAHLQQCTYEGGVGYTSGWETVRPATDQDRADMSAGRISYDPDTEPHSLAWAKHIAAGGD
jgi:hypothetical protein